MALKINWNLIAAYVITAAVIMMFVWNIANFYKTETPEPQETQNNIQVQDNPHQNYSTSITMGDQTQTDNRSTSELFGNSISIIDGQTSSRNRTDSRGSKTEFCAWNESFELCIVQINEMQPRIECQGAQDTEVIFNDQKVYCPVYVIKPKGRASALHKPEPDHISADLEISGHRIITYNGASIDVGDVSGGNFHRIKVYKGNAVLIIKSLNGKVTRNCKGSGDKVSASFDGQRFDCPP